MSDDQRATPVLPDRDFAIKRGWKYQVQWIERGNQCFMRCASGLEADAFADRLMKAGLRPFVIDLTDALQLH